MLPNVLVMLRGISHFALMLLLAAPAMASGLLYFKERNRYLEPTEEPKEQTHEGGRSYIPFVLMALNASIGVPIILAYSTIIYGSVGVPSGKSEHLSIYFPVLQLTLLFELHGDRTSLIKATAMSRSFFWILAAVTSASFLPILDASSFFSAMLPYFLVSLALYVFLVFRQSVVVQMTAVGMRKKSYECLSHTNDNLHIT